MKKTYTSILIMILIASLLTACIGTETPTETPDVLMTSLVGTMVAAFFATQTALVTPTSPPPTATLTALPTFTVIYPTATLAPTLTPTYLYFSPTPGTVTITPTGTLSTATVDGSALAVGCNNLALIRDVNIPAGTVIEKGQDFNKTWKVQNNGTCNWMYQFSLVPAGGDLIGGEATKIQKLVSVWGWSELSLELQAPKQPGTYVGYWRLSDGQSAFGATLTVSIVVPDVMPTETVTP